MPKKEPSRGRGGPRRRGAPRLGVGPDSGDVGRGRGRGRNDGGTSANGLESAHGGARSEVSSCARCDSLAARIEQLEAGLRDKLTSDEASDVSRQLTAIVTRLDALEKANEHLNGRIASGERSGDRHGDQLGQIWRRLEELDTHKKKAEKTIKDSHDAISLLEAKLIGRLEQAVQGCERSIAAIAAGHLKHDKALKEILKEQSGQHQWAKDVRQELAAIKHIQSRDTAKLKQLLGHYQRLIGYLEWLVLQILNPLIKIVNQTQLQANAIYHALATAHKIVDVLYKHMVQMTEKISIEVTAAFLAGCPASFFHSPPPGFFNSMPHVVAFERLPHDLTDDAVPVASGVAAVSAHQGASGAAFYQPPGGGGSGTRGGPPPLTSLRSG